jgi:hypothetical protein
MTTSPAEPVDNDQSSSDDQHTDQGISDDQLPEDLQPGPDNPLASPDEDVSEAPKPQASDDP